MPRVGDPSHFAIDYELMQFYPPAGRLRMWLHGSSLGDYEETYLYHPLSSLSGLSSKRGPGRTLCDWRAEINDMRKALDNSSLSLGEAFDNCRVALYVIKDNRAYGFIWEMCSAADESTPNYFQVLWSEYDRVVNLVTSTISEEILAATGQRLSFA
jgi:hypothetical protein